MYNIIKGSYKIVNDIMFIRENEEITALFIGNGDYDYIETLDSFDDEYLIDYEIGFRQGLKELTREETIKYYKQLKDEALESARQFNKTIMNLINHRE